MTGRKTLGQRIARNWELYLFILPVRRADGVSGIRAWFIRDNVVQATTLQPGYRDAVTWLHSIYAEGLLDQEAFTYEIQAYRAKNQDGVIGVSPTWGGWNIVPEGSAAQAKEWWTPIPPLAGPDGSRDAEFKALSGIGNGLVITNASEMPEALVRYVDLNYIPENGVQWSLGPLGHNLFQDDQGADTSRRQPSTTERISETAVVHDARVVPSWAASNFLPDERRMEAVPAARHHVRHQRGLSADEIAEAGVYLTDINSYIQSKEAEWVVNGKIDQETCSRTIRAASDTSRRQPSTTATASSASPLRLPTSSHETPWRRQDRE